MKLFAIDIYLRDKDYNVVNACKCQYVINIKRLFLIPFAISLSDEFFTVELCIKYRVSIIDLFDELDKKKLLSVINQLKIDSLNVYKPAISSDL